MFSPGQGSRTLDRSQIRPIRAVPPGFRRQRDPSRSPWLVRVPPARSRKRNTPHARMLFCPASRSAVFQSFVNLSPAARRTSQNELRARPREQARLAPSHRRRPAHPRAASNAVPCLRHFRRTLEHFPRTREAHRHPPAMPVQQEKKARTLSRARDTRRASPGWMRREKV